MQSILNFKPLTGDEWRKLQSESPEEFNNKVKELELYEIFTDLLIGSKSLSFPQSQIDIR